MKKVDTPRVRSSFRDRVLVAMRRLGIGTSRGAGFNELDRLMGKAIGFTSQVIGRTSSPRLDSVILLAKTLRVRLEWLATDQGPMELGVAPEGAETYGQLGGWTDAAAQVKGVPVYAVAAVSKRPVLLRPDRVSVEFVRALAGFWLSWAPAAEIDAAALADIAARDPKPANS